MAGHFPVTRRKVFDTPRIKELRGPAIADVYRRIRRLTDRPDASYSPTVATAKKWESQLPSTRCRGTAKDRLSSFANFARLR